VPLHRFSLQRTFYLVIHMHGATRAPLNAQRVPGNDGGHVTDVAHEAKRGAHCGAPLRCANQSPRYESRLDRAGFADGAVPPIVPGATVVPGVDDDDGFGGRGGLPAMMSPI
jgi:hypothetical protein